ncbi:NAD(P)/FAD-dependent oxidoreductase [Roseivirga sp. BDSF3-8]|uniref:NAD(P)/FAD-dependent oxidoreductase n=1 Tax=Roseivirga sp. BDSF3-8 TaxID=3241598 RepID=UPI003531E013
MQPVVAVIGGGAAGFFGALTIAAHRPGVRVMIFEKTGKVLSKVRVSGGGRCNVTHDCFQPGKLATFYPRGGRMLKKLFGRFSASDTVQWFKERGVELKTEADGRIFPVSDSSQTIIDLFMREASRLGVEIRTRCVVTEIAPDDEGFSLTTSEGMMRANKVLVSAGGHSKESAYDWLKNLGHEIIPPVPSLFTFNVPREGLNDLAGIALPDARVKVEGSKWEYTGPLLITHWGFSGPAVLKTSAWAARDFFEKKYAFNIHVSWNASAGEEAVRALIHTYLSDHGTRKIHKYPLMDLPQRLWTRLCERAEIEPNRTWAELPKKNRNKLVEELVRSHYTVAGKTTFKEEFVTAGGVALTSVNAKTMESKHINGMYFSGEILDVDGVTGGFNFQAAWSTAFIAGKAISTSI